MNKQELLGDIKKIPNFKKRDIYVMKEHNDIMLGNAEPVMKEERLIGITEENNYPLISTVSKGYQILQFKDLYEPIVNHFDEVNGELFYHFGSSVMSLFPEGDNFKTDDGKPIGLIVSNSVNKALAININFCIGVGKRKVMLPKKISSFRKLHLGNVGQLVSDYQRFIVDVKQLWRIVMEKFNRDLTEDDVKNVIAQLKLGNRYADEVRKTFSVVEGLKLWDLFMEVVDMISESTYRKEENRINKLKKVSEVMYTYAVAEAL